MASRIKPLDTTGCGHDHDVVDMPKGPKGEKRPADVIDAAITVAKIAGTKRRSPERGARG